VEPWFKFFYVFVGAAGATYYTRNAPSGVGRMKSMFPNWSEHTYVRIDVFLLLVISTITSNVLYAPQDPVKAIIAGFSSVALLKQLLKGSK
jgi:hypothetical protein